MTKKKSKFGICAICGNENKLTREHIPPKGIFLPPRPPNTITVFSCEKCNHDTKLDDEYFRFWVASGACSPKTQLGKLWEDKVVGSSFRRSPALFQKIQNDHDLLIQHHSKVPLITYDNKIFPDELIERCYMVDAERINRVACKIVKGLYFHHYSEPLPANLEFTVSDEPIHTDILNKIIIDCKGEVGGKDREFIYWFKFDENEFYFSKWVLIFYHKNYLRIETRLKIV